MTFPSHNANQNITQLDDRPRTFSLYWLRSKIVLSTYWCSEQDKRARRIKRYRQYYDGDHDARLTPNMQKLLRIKDADDGFTLNMMPTVVDTMMDRVIAQSIEATIDDPTPADPAGDGPAQKAKPIVNAPTAWIQQILEDNYFDDLQGDVHSAAGRDGDAYVMISYDEDDDCVKWTYEPAWDGQSGMLMVYPSRNVKKPAAAIKIWQLEASGDNLPLPKTGSPAVSQSIARPGENVNVLAENTNTIMYRINIYRPDRIEKYYTLGADMLPYDVDGDAVQDWTMPDGSPIGIPVIHFPNRGRDNYGVSELRNAISPQNAMNRFNYSAVMAAELTAFAVFIANGFQAPAAITPGMIVQMAKELIGSDYKDPTFNKLPATEITPILEMIDAQRRMISEITRTPSPDLAAGSGSNKSGEYLKQLEVGLIGKARRFMTRAGQSWEQGSVVSHRIQTVFGAKKPPAYKRFFTRWRSPEIRNETELVQNALAVSPKVGDRQFLRFIAPVYDLDEMKINEILEERMADEVKQAQAMQQQPGQQPGQVTDTVNLATGKVQVQEGQEQIGDNAQPPQADAKPTPQGNKLPSDQATNADHLTKDHFANLFDQYHATKQASNASAKVAA